jgi:malate dehydrogenase
MELIMKVAVLGAAGGIGQALALLLKNRLPAGSELSLYDIAPVTPGVAADLSHIPTDVKVKGFCGEDPSPALVGADVVLISAGVARKPGMDRSDLFNINAGIVKNLVEKCAASCPKALIGIITNPVNTTVAIAAEVLKKAGVYDKRRLFGVTTLDVIRGETFVAEAKGLNVDKVRVNVIGGHSGVTILPLRVVVSHRQPERRAGTRLRHAVDPVQARHRAGDNIRQPLAHTPALAGPVRHHGCEQRQPPAGRAHQPPGAGPRRCQRR